MIPARPGPSQHFPAGNPCPALHSRPLGKTNDTSSANNPAGIRLAVLVIVLFGALLSCTGIAGANEYLGGIPLQTVSHGEVSGGLYYGVYPGFATTAHQSFSLPAYKDIAWARVYVSVYCGHKQNNYPGTATINLDTNGDGTNDILLATETMDVPYSYPGAGGTGPVDLGHGNRVTSDYLFWYDVKDQIQGNKKVGVDVTTAKATSSSSFDGRIKFIALIVAYNDGDRDKVYYWVNQGHDPMDAANDNGYTGETEFGTSAIAAEEDEEFTATLSSLYMASEDGTYTFNGDELSNGKPQGSYFGYEDWDVSDSITLDEDSTLQYGRSAQYFKLPLALLTVRFKEQPEGTLEVTSYPEGAQILLDGEELDKVTNQTLTGISIGEHSVQVIPEDTERYREPDERTVTLNNGETLPVHFVISPITGSVDITSDPQDAWIYLDGKNTSRQSDTLLEDVIVGNHTIVLKKAGYRDANATVTLEEDKVEPVSLTMIGKDGNSTGLTGNVTGSLGYTGTALTLYAHDTVHGGLAVTGSGSYSGLLGKGMDITYPLTANLTPNATVKDARLYVYSTWSYDADALAGKPSSLQATFNGEPLERDRVYSDRKGEGTYDYPVETHCYRIDGDLLADAPSSITITNIGGEADKVAVYGVLLVAAYEDPLGPDTEYWIGEGSDAVYATPEFGVDSEHAVTRITFPGAVNTTAISGSELYAVSTAASGTADDNNRVTFNDRTWQDPMTAGSSGISIARLNVSGEIRQSGNRAGIGSVIEKTKGDYMENRNLILVLTSTGEGAATTGISVSGEPGEENTTEESRVLSVDLNATVLATGPIEESLNQTGRYYTIRVLSNPPGAMILLDYQYCGKATPDTIRQVPGGNHTVSVELPGFDTVEERIFLSTNQTMTFDMETHGTTLLSEGKIPEGQQALLNQEDFGGIYVTSSPEKAVIYIDGKKTGFSTPGLIYGISPGKHTVQVKLVSKTAGQNTLKFPIEKKEVWVDAGVISETTFLHYENPYISSPMINSTAYNNSVFTVNGEMRQYRVPEKVDLQESQNYLTFREGDAYITHTVFAGIADNETWVEPRRYTLNSVMIESEPAGADIYVDGFPTGLTTPYLIKNLSDMEHRIVVSKPGYYPVENTFRIAGTDLYRRFVLEPYMNGRLSIMSTPPGGKIYLNGKYTGQKTPYTFQYMEVGLYSVKVVLNQTKAVVDDYFIEPNVDNELNLTLKKKE